MPNLQAAQSLHQHLHHVTHQEAAWKLAIQLSVVDAKKTDGRKAEKCLPSLGIKIFCVCTKMEKELTAARVPEQSLTPALVSWAILNICS